MLIQGNVQAPSNVSATDGNNYTALQGKAAELIVAELHGKYHTWTYRGNTFIGATAQAGITIPSSTSLSPTFGLWNPAGSGKIAVPVRLIIAQPGLLGITGTVGLATTTGAGSAIGTGAPVTAFTAGTAQLAYQSGQGASVMKFTASAATLTNVPTVLEWTSAQFSSTATTLAPITQPAPIDFDGSLLIGPGTFVTLCYGSTGTVSGTVVAAMKWLEIPV